MLTWIDLETTGLDPKEGYPLEVAMVITTDDLQELVTYTSPIWVYPPSLDSTLDPYVRMMHLDNGLLAEIPSAPNLRDVEKEMVRLYRASAIDHALPLAGSTISFDREWLKEHFVNFAPLLHYRNVDVSTLKELNRRWRFAPEWPKKEAHRALDDIQDSIEELRYYKQALLDKSSAS